MRHRIFCSYVVSIFLMVTSHYTRSVPMSFKRLVKFDENQNIEKVVDLIGDYHEPLLDVVKKASTKRKKKLLQLDEKKALTVAERTFLQTLREVAQQPYDQNIDLLWELAEGRSANQRKFFPASIFVESLLFDAFIHSVGRKLKQEFKQLSRIIFTDTDTYRSDVFTWIILDQNITSEVANIPVLEAAKPLLDLIDPDNPKIGQDLNMVKKYAQSDIVNQLISSWEKHKQMVLKPFIDEYIQQYLTNNPAITIGELQEFVIKQKLPSFDAFGDIIDDVTDPIIEHEILFKLFGSTNKYTIVYAGSTHTANIHKKLIDEFGFVTLVNIGDVTDIDLVKMLGIGKFGEEYYSLQLTPDAWKLLKNKPENAVLAYHSHGPIERTVNLSYWQEIKKILQNTTEDQELLNTLDNWIKVGFHNYINSPNIIILGKPLLVLFIEKGWKSAVHLLLKYGANPNAHFPNFEGEFRYISALDVAKKMNNQEIVNLLLQYGAQPTFERPTSIPVEEPIS